MAWTEGSGVLQGGEQNILVYSSTSKSIGTDESIIGELVEFSGIGGKKEAKEFRGYHYKQTHRYAGQSTPNDLSFTEYLTKEGLKRLREKYDTGEKFYVVIVDNNTTSGKADDKILYACYGEISEWGMELPDGEKCKITYTFVVDDDNVTGITLSEGE